MAKSRDAFGQILNTLRARLREGAIGPGQALSIADLAIELRTSTTPVREALATLTGEGLVLRLRRTGFRRPALTARQLAEHYSLHHGQVDWALRSAESAPPLALVDLPVVCSASELFAHLVEVAGNAALTRAHSLELQILAAAFAIESRVLKGVEEEMAVLRAEAAAGEVAALRARLGDYHQRRIAACPRLEAEIERAEYTSI